VPEGVERRAVCVVQPGGDSEVHRIREPTRSGRGNRKQLGIATGRAESTDDMVANRPASHAVADGRDDTGGLAAGNVRRRRMELILVLEHEGVGERHRRCLHLDQQLAVTGRRVVHLLDDQGLGRPERLAHDSFHGCRQ